MLGGLAVADRLGVDRQEAIRYWRSNRDRTDFPDPDGHIGGQPWWWSTTVEAWLAARTRPSGRHRT